MRRRIITSVLAAILLSVCLPPNPLQAQAGERGLTLSPVRDFITVAPGAVSQRKIVIANTTEKDIRIDLSYEQFTVKNYSYEYSFSDATEKWITFSEDTLILAAGQSKTISYNLAPPSNAVPGGHYFTILAAAVLQSGAVTSHVRVATMVYATVTGKIGIKSELKTAAVPKIWFNGDLPFNLEVASTGNTHFFGYISGQLQGLGASRQSSEITRLVMPRTSIKVSGTIPAPMLPGVYKVQYGYKTDSGEHIFKNEKVVYIPVWVWLVVGGAVWVIITWRRLALRRGFKGSSPPPYTSQ